MRPSTFFSTLLAATAATVTSAAASSDDDHNLLLVAPIYIQPVSSTGAPTLLAEVQYPSLSSSQDNAPAATAADSQRPEVISYEAPDLPEDIQLVRIGIWDEKVKKWSGSTSVVSVNNFGKGYSPHFVLTLASEDEKQVAGVVVRGVKIDAGHTRDFGPQVVVTRAEQGKQPSLGKNVMLSPEGRKVGEVGEKSFLQKYWWAIAIGAVLMVTGGGDGK
ncbi:hypothetical protein QBC43DRAFT_311671 [Cladorrhinum sp. PSN259]|nr:hypothetical protein QBC43DRAFT_311671 [Cladorrhinum sp. PSN259]